MYDETPLIFEILAELKANNVDYYKFPVDDEMLVESNARLNVNFYFFPFNSFFNFLGVSELRSVRSGRELGFRQTQRKNGQSSSISVGNCRRHIFSPIWIIFKKQIFDLKISFSVENEDHCDFVKLREALLRLNVEDLRERTHRVLYETYRRQRLQEMGVKDGDLGPGLQQVYEQVIAFSSIFSVIFCLISVQYLLQSFLFMFQRRAEHLSSVRTKEEQLKTYFVQKVKEKEKEITDKENEVSEILFIFILFHHFFYYIIFCFFFHRK